MENIHEQLIRHEGEKIESGKHVLYTDSEGVLTIGYGHNLEEGIPQYIADELLRYGVRVARAEAETFSWFEGLNDARRDVIVNMCFNLGITKFRKFVRTIAALDAGDYETAADEMLDSKWRRQVKDRATELAEQMRTGERQQVA